MSSTITPHPVWSVRVLFPLRFRERKHSVGHYRVGAANEEAAVEAVRAVIADLYPTQPGTRIISCTQTGMSDGVVGNGFTTMSPHDADEQPTL